MIHAGFSPLCPHKCVSVTVFHHCADQGQRKTVKEHPLFHLGKSNKSLQTYDHMHTLIPSQSSPQHSVTSDLLPPECATDISWAPYLVALSMCRMCFLFKKNSCSSGTNTVDDPWKLLHELFGNIQFLRFHFYHKSWTHSACSPGLFPFLIWTSFICQIRWFFRVPFRRGNHLLTTFWCGRMMDILPLAFHRSVNREVQHHSRWPLKSHSHSWERSSLLGER